MNQRLVSRATLLACAWLVAACSTTSPPNRYHSLVAPPAAGAAVVLPAPEVQVQVLSVALPAQVDVPQLVVRLPDDSMAVLEYERWIGPLGDEIRDALTLRIERALLQNPPASDHDRRWRVRLDVQRFDSMLGRAAAVQVQWSLRAVGAGGTLRCQASYEQTVGPGVVALVAGHRALFERLGDTIGQALKTAAAGGTPSCG